MNRKDLLIGSIHTLAFSWGSDTPPEVYWGMRDLVEWIEAEFSVKIKTIIDENNPQCIDDLCNEIENL